MSNSLKVLIYDSYVWDVPGIPERSSGDRAGGKFARPEREKSYGTATEFADSQKQTWRSRQTHDGREESTWAWLLVGRGLEWPSQVAEQTKAPGTSNGQVDG